VYCGWQGVVCARKKIVRSPIQPTNTCCRVTDLFKMHTEPFSFYVTVKKHWILHLQEKGKSVWWWSLDVFLMLRRMLWFLVWNRVWNEATRSPVVSPFPTERCEPSVAYYLPSFPASLLINGPGHEKHLPERVWLRSFVVVGVCLRRFVLQKNLFFVQHSALLVIAPQFVHVSSKRLNVVLFDLLCCVTTR